MSTGIQQRCMKDPTAFQYLYGTKWYVTHIQNPIPASTSGRFGRRNQKLFTIMYILIKDSKGFEHKVAILRLKSSVCWQIKTKAEQIKTKAEQS